MKNIAKLNKVEIEFKENNKLWQIVLDAMSEAVFLIDLDHKILQCNRATSDILGKSNCNEIKGHSCWELVHGSSKPVDWCPVKRMRETGQREATIRMLNNKWVEISADPVLNEDGEISGAVHIITDISARKKTEDALKQSEQQYLTILNSLRDGMHVVDKDLRIIYQNPSMIQWLEKLNLNSDYIGKTVFEAFPFLDYNKIYNEYDKVFKDKELLITTEATKLIDRNYFTETSKIPIVSQGEVNHIITILRDITDQKRAEQKLKESEEKFRNIAEQSLLGIAILQDDKFKYVNQRFAEIAGMSQEGMKNMGPGEFLKMVHPEERQMIAEQARKKQIGDKNVINRYQFRGYKKTGEALHGELFSKTINYQGKPADFITMIDITDKIETERKFLKSEENYRYLIENSIEGVWVIDSFANTTLVNPSMENLLGYSADEMIGKSVFSFMDEEQAKITKNHLEKRRRGISEMRDAVFIHKNGSKVYLRINATPILDNDGNYEGTYAFVEDISQRRLTEQKLKESEENFRTIAEHAFIGTLIIQDDNVKYINDALLQIFEYSNEEIENYKKSDLIKLIHPEDLHYLRKYRQKLRDGNSDIKPYYSYRVFTKYGKIKWIDQFSKPIIYQGKPAELVTIMDITEQKKAEQELIKLNKLKSELLRRTSHELKTPLVSIKGFSDLLLTVHKDKLDDYVLATIHEIKLGCERLENLVQDILKTSELESESVELKKKQEDLSFLIKLCVRELQGLIRLRNHEINLEIHDKLITWFEPDQIHLVLSNLINNAIKYTPPNGKITIKSAITDDYILISIQDNGIGLTYDEKKRLFTQFGKIERYGQGLDIIPEGSGLGLYITKKIIELHGGRIRVKSGGRNKGSTFCFTLPLITEENK